jgi:hypothetical protein
MLLAFALLCALMGWLVYTQPLDDTQATGSEKTTATVARRCFYWNGTRPTAQTLAASVTARSDQRGAAQYESYPVTGAFASGITRGLLSIAT